jgi:hypothetical protein
MVLKADSMTFMQEEEVDVNIMRDRIITGASHNS